MNCVYTVYQCSSHNWLGQVQTEVGGEEPEIANIFSPLETG